ncbi:Chitotriosidase-1 like protein [Verticillium longisporum]|nr:Chitotriosidase-1 like protein [Verticillium longisporum]
MRSQSSTSLTVFAVVGIILLCLPALIFADVAYQPRAGRTIAQRDSDNTDLSWRDQIVFSPAHQDPAKAPAVPIAALENSTTASIPAVSVFNPRGLNTFQKRQALRCDDGPCIDGSCCSKEKICGYGPSYCGAGNCTSQCDATAMCGEYSENAEMPCGSGSSSKRKVGYYQSWNVRDRRCNKVSPSQLDTTGYTHLFYSFAFIDPKTFRITPAHSDDDSMMREFTKLSKDGKLQTWIATGGFDFSNPEVATHTTWSDMVSTKANRAAFIASVKEYMDTYGFQGVDLDWEYPGAPERGGRKLADVRNFPMLLREMRAAYGSSYGISLTLAPDYWYLRWFDAKAMEPSVDFFGFMAYDLHGSWDADVLALGKKVRGQADIREIANNTIPLWFDGLDPKKINFGLAMYGRGYTLADPKCNQLLCPFSGPSKPAPCTAFGGVMSLVEIKQLIKERGITPQYLADSMMKQITWDDQWIGYDDEETFAAKQAFADGMCFGGTMVWSIDFQVPGSGGHDQNENTVYLDPKVYEVSLDLPPFVTTITGPGGVQTRTLLLPPWPQITNGPPESWTTSGNPWTNPGVTGVPAPTDVIPLPPPEMITKTPYTGPGGSVDPTGTWPTSFDIQPVSTSVPDDGEDDDDDGPKSKSTCNLWFFWTCIDIGGIKIGGWEWNLPQGIWGPGPPPIGRINPPPGFTFKGNLPNWPKITVGPGGKVTAPPKPASCTPAEASLCATTTSFGTTVQNGVTKTTTTQVKETCATITGCNLRDVDSTETGRACSLAKRTINLTGVPLPEMTAAAEPPPDIAKRANSIWDCEETGEDGIIWPQDPKEGGQTRIRALLQERKDALGGTHSWTEVRAGDLDYTAFYYVDNMGPVAQAYFDSDEVKEINRAYNYRADIAPRLSRAQLRRSKAKRSAKASDSRTDAPVRVETLASDGVEKLNEAADSLNNETPDIGKRATSPEISDRWHLSHISIPERVDWDVDDDPHIPSQNKFAYYFNNREGSGQTVYIMEERTGQSGEFTGQLKAPLSPHSYLSSMWYDDDPDDVTEMRRHGTVISAMVGGVASAIARQASLVVVPTKLEVEEDWPLEIFLASLVAISQDIVKEKKPQDTTIVNMSFGIPMKYAEPHFWTIMRQLMVLMEAKYGTVFVAASGNAEPDPADGPLVDPGVFIDANSMPYEAMPYVPGMMVVGASNREGYRRKLSMVGKNVEFWAPGEQLPYPLGVSNRRQINGGSPAAGLVSGLVASLRSDPTFSNFVKPAQLKQQMKSLARAISYQGVTNADKPVVVYNGQRSDQSCPPNSNAGAVSERRLTIRQVESCPLPGQPGNPEGVPVPSLTYRPGPPGPLCTANCGRLCEGFFCVPQPTGTPPEFTPPSNPGATGPGWVPPPPVTLPNLPTLPPSEPGVTPGPGTVCLSSATVTQCNGRPGQAVCVTSTSCASFGTLGPFPTLPPSVTSPPGGICVSTATWVITGGPKGEATVTTSGCGKWTVPSAPEPTPNPPSPPPPPERNHGVVVISYYEFGQFTVGGTFWTREHRAFSVPFGGQIKQCSASAIASQSAPGVLASAKLPTKMGPFQAEGRTCEYSGSPNSPGQLSCDGLPTVSCEGASQTDICGSGTPIMKALAFCRF